MLEREGIQSRKGNNFRTVVFTSISYIHVQYLKKPQVPRTKRWFQNFSWFTDIFLFWAVSKKKQYCGNYYNIHDLYLSSFGCLFRYMSMRYRESHNIKLKKHQEIVTLNSNVWHCFNFSPLSVGNWIIFQHNKQHSYLEWFDHVLTFSKATVLCTLRIPVKESCLKEDKLCVTY